MEPLQELLAVDQQRALEFFVTGLQDVSSPGVDRQELLYNASVLAHYAQVSTGAELEMPAPANLSAVFDNFVFNTSTPPDAHLMETAGAQCLLLTGFFEDQMRGRHDIRWYAELGAGFFMRAAGSARATKRGSPADHDREALRALAADARAAQAGAPRSAVPPHPAIVPDVVMDRTRTQA